MTPEQKFAFDAAMKQCTGNRYDFERIFLAGWNARGKRDAEICRKLPDNEDTDADLADQCADAIEEEDSKPSQSDEFFAKHQRAYKDDSK